MKVRIVHAAGEWAAGQVVDLPDRRAAGLIQSGYAEAVGAEPEQAIEATADGRGRGKKPEKRG